MEGGSELKDFIDLPWKIYAKYPRWVPPLKKEVRRMLDPRKHPFWELSERILFLARRGSETVGRIAGIIDRHYNQFHGEKMGIWGFFECTDDPEAAAALFSSVEKWALQKGMTFMRGPPQPVHQLRGGIAHRGIQLSACLDDGLQPTVLPRVARIVRFHQRERPVSLPDRWRLPASRVAAQRNHLNS